MLTMARPSAARPMVQRMPAFTRMSAPVLHRRDGEVTHLLTLARLEAACSAYQAALRWLRSLPAPDVERRLAMKVAEVERAIYTDALPTCDLTKGRSLDDIRWAITRLCAAADREAPR
jgi:hypothetical protein